MKLRAEFVARTNWALEQEKVANERTEWALALDREIARLGGCITELQSELEAARVQAEQSAALERTAWVGVGRKLGLLRKS